MRFQLVALVGVDREDPIVGCDLGGVVALGAVSGPVVGFDAGVMVLCERDGLVGTVGIDDENLVGPLDRRERALDVGGLVPP